MNQAMLLDWFEKEKCRDESRFFSTSEVFVKSKDLLGFNERQIQRHVRRLVAYGYLDVKFERVRSGFQPRYRAKLFNGMVDRRIV